MLLFSRLYVGHSAAAWVRHNKAEKKERETKKKELKGFRSTLWSFPGQDFSALLVWFAFGWKDPRATWRWTTTARSARVGKSAETGRQHIWVCICIFLSHVECLSVMLLLLLARFTLSFFALFSPSIAYTYHCTISQHYTFSQLFICWRVSFCKLSFLP